MKAKKINEVQEFKRGQSSKKSLNVGGIRTKEDALQELDSMRDDLEKLGLNAWHSAEEKNFPFLSLIIDDIDPDYQFSLVLHQPDPRDPWIYDIRQGSRRYAGIKAPIFSSEDYVEIWEEIKKIALNGREKVLNSEKETLKHTKALISEEQRKIQMIQDAHL